MAQRRRTWAFFVATALAAGFGVPDTGQAQSTAAGTVTVDESGALHVRVTDQDCRRLVVHEPAPGVAYQPGVDVRGKSVAPADLHGAAEITLPEVVSIPIEVDLYRRAPRNGDASESDPRPDPDPDVGLGQDLDPSLDGDAQIGTVEIDLHTGRATFNGQPLTSEAQHRLNRRCQEIIRRE